MRSADFADRVVEMVRRYVCYAMILTAIGIGCSTSQLNPLPQLPPAPPPYVHVPHPEGMDLGDLMLVFTHRDAPALDSLGACDSDFVTLQSKTVSRDELEQGALEFVQSDPVKYHWCFYGKLLELDGKLKEEPYIDQRQKRVLNTFQFLTPIAKAFHDEYQESRYLRWAVIRYRQLSEFVFYRRLELAPDAAMGMGTTVNPFGLLRAPSESRGGVLEKYGLIRPEAPVEVNAEGPVPVSGAAGIERAPAATTAAEPKPIEVYPRTELQVPVESAAPVLPAATVPAPVPSPAQQQ